MTKKEKAGLGLIGFLFAILCFMLYLTVKPSSNKVYSPEESIFVQQRVKNLQKR